MSGKTLQTQVQITGLWFCFFYILEAQNGALKDTQMSLHIFHKVILNINANIRFNLKLSETCREKCEWFQHLLAITVGIKCIEELTRHSKLEPTEYNGTCPSDPKIIL